MLGARVESVRVAVGRVGAAGVGRKCGSGVGGDLGWWGVARNEGVAIKVRVGVGRTVVLGLGVVATGAGVMGVMGGGGVGGGYEAGRAGVFGGDMGANGGLKFLVGARLVLHVVAHRGHGGAGRGAVVRGGRGALRSRPFARHASKRKGGGAKEPRGEEEHSEGSSSEKDGPNVSIIVICGI